MREIIINKIKDLTGFVAEDDKLLSELGLDEYKVVELCIFVSDKINKDRWVNQFTDMAFLDFLELVEYDIANN